MYWPDPTTKNDPERRWNQPDRIFFGFGACQILAGVFLEETQAQGFYGEWIIPKNGAPGNHMFATNGHIAFDYHGYSDRQKLLTHYWKGYQNRYPNWDAKIVKIDFPLLDTNALNTRQHLGPDQYIGDPIERARRFIKNIQKPSCDHKKYACDHKSERYR